MNKEDIYRRSLELARKCISDTTKEELEKEISFYKKMGIEGPTFAEYLNILQNELDVFCATDNIEDYFSFDKDELFKYETEGTAWFYPPPDSSHKNIYHKNDSVKIKESFFFIIIVLLWR